MPLNNQKIVHIDMDAFYASIEQRDYQELKGLPVIVGGSPEERGVVAAASYEARRFGIHSAMPCARAKKLCPDAVFVRPRFSVYRAISDQIMQILSKYSECIEPLSLDEAYLDVTDSPLFEGSATRIAQAIRKQIAAEIQLTASAGVSYNKFLAKMASGQNKPDGLTVITPGQGQAFIHALPIGQFYGIGQATEAKMHALGIYYGADLYQCSQAYLVKYFGKFGHWYHQLARGEDDRPVCAYRERKSLGNEITFPTDLGDIEAMRTVLNDLAESLLHKLQEKRLYAKGLTIKVRYADFETATRSKTFTTAISQVVFLGKHIDELLSKTDAGQKPVRLLGVSFHQLYPQDSSLGDLFSD